MTRSFVANRAIRERTPVLIGLVGPSGSGKTFSALRLAAGIQRITGGETFFIDTEARRALHYADKFTFQHVPFGAPFSPLDYLDAINFCVSQAAPGKPPTIIVDSFSHQHEGPGGLLEMHQAEHARLGGREGTKLLAWGKPKAARRRLINTILQIEANMIFCFRAKQKLKIEKGKDPENLGYQPIGADDMLYDLTLKALLLPGANGVPTWQSDMLGEKEMIKLPGQFRALFERNPPPQLTEEIGETLAKWGAGDAKAMESKAVSTFAELLAKLEACSEGATFRSLQADSRAAWSTFSKAEKEKIGAAGKAAEARIQKANEAPPEPPAEVAELTEADKAEIARLEAEEAKKAAS
jgi:ABC-type oligopeptide transport system ATPase subunit